MYIFIGIRTNEVPAIETYIVLINLVRIVYLEKILKILGRASQNIRIFKILKHSRHQFYCLRHVIATEIHVIIYNGAIVLSLIHNLFYFVTQQRRDSIIRAYHQYIILSYLRHFHVKSQFRIILVEYIFRIVPFVKESQRHRRFTVWKHIHAVCLHTVFTHIFKNNLPYPVIPSLTDESHIHTHSSERYYAIIY